MMSQVLASFQAAQIGFQLSFTQGTVPPNFSGATLTLYITSPSGAVSNTTAVLLDAQTPYYLTTGTDFPTAGTYQVQLEYVDGDETYWSPVGKVKVLANSTS